MINIIHICCPVNLSVPWSFILHDYTKRGRESRPADTVAFWVKLLSLEFPWLGSITSQGKAIVLSHKHKHMHKVHVCTLPLHMHNPTLFLMQFTQPCPIMAWSYHISKNTRFSTNTWSDQGRGSCTPDSEVFLGCGKILVLSGLNMNTSLLRSCVTLSCTLPKWRVICWPVVPPPGTADCSENAAWYINVFFVGYKCDLSWNVGLVRSSHTAADRTQGSLLLLQSRLATEQ